MLFWFLLGLVQGTCVAILVWHIRSKTVSGTLILNLYDDDAEAVPISLELYIPIEEVRKKKTVQLEVYESR